MVELLDLVMDKSDQIRNYLDDAMHEDVGREEHQLGAVELLLGHPRLPLCPYH